MLHEEEYVPEGCVVFPHQVAGHRFQGGKRGILLDNDGKLLKCVQMPPRGEREVNFYQSVFGTDVSDSVTLKLRSFLPAFHGIKVASPSSFQLDDYIKLDDLTRNFNKPCVLDIKVGQTIFDHFATQIKRERVKQKYPEQELFGFRILGMKVYKKDVKSFKVYDKSFGKKLKTHQEVLEGFREFFCPGDHGNKYISEILKELRVIESWFQEQRRFRLFSSSILIVYEGEPRTTQNELIECNCLQQMTKHAESCDNIQNCGNKPGDNLGNCRNCCHTLNDVAKHMNFLNVPQVTVRLVDFAHTYIGKYTEADTNYLYGLQSIMQCMEELLTYQ